MTAPLWRSSTSGQSSHHKRAIKVLLAIEINWIYIASEAPRATQAKIARYFFGRDPVQNAQEPSQPALRLAQSVTIGDRTLPAI
jgi:hypothetical protein